MTQRGQEKFFKSKLSNGTAVVGTHIPYLRSVAIGFWIKAGSRNESPELNGISHFLEHLAFKGTKRRTAHQIAIEMDSIGGHVDAFTDREFICFYAKILDEHLPKAVDILSDILLNSIYDPVEIERERQVILEEISMVEDAHSDHLSDLLYQKIWTDHPLGRPIQGFPKTVKNISRQDILSHMERFLASNNIIISIAGNFEFPAVIELLEKHFENYNASKKIPPHPVKEIKSGLICQYRKLEQVHFYLATLGLKANDAQRYECYLLNAIMGGSMSSRLFQKIREERGLAYSINSGNSQYHDAGIFSVYAATGTKNYLAVLELIIKEFNDIRNNKVDETELEKAKNQLKGLLMLSLESSESRMFQLAKEEIFFGKHFTLDEILESINKVTTPGIKSLGSKLFKSQFYNLALLGPIRKNKALEEVLHS